MTSIDQRIEQARKAGHSDQEIFAGLKNGKATGAGYQKARAAGLSDEQIAKDLGLSVTINPPKKQKDLGRAQPIKIEVKAEKPSFLADVGAGMDKVYSGVAQGAEYAADGIRGGLNKLLGTNLETDRYERYTKHKADERKTYKESRKASGKGANVGEFIGETVATLPLAALGKGYGAAKVLSKPGAAVTAQNAGVGALVGGIGFTENAEQRLNNIKSGAIGGVVGGLAGKGLDKISKNSAKKVSEKATQKTLDKPMLTLAKDARQTGYSIPPSYTNPNFINKSLAKIAGEADLARIASANNQKVTNNLARKSIGLPEDQPITIEALTQVRKDAGQAYEVVKGLGQIKTDRRFAKDISDITKTYISAGRDFAVKGGDRIQNVVSQIQGDKFGADAALDMIKIARGDASAAFRAGDTDLGLANQKLANAIEGQLERSVAQNTKVPRAAVQNLINARKVIAKTYSIESALDAGGNVSARKLASTLGKKPLSSELKQAAEFSQMYPQLNNIGVHGGNGITLFDGLVGVGGGAATGNPGVAALALGRPALKAGLNTKVAGKALGTPSYDSKLMKALMKANILTPVAPIAGANISNE